MQSLTVVIPTYNEATNIGPLVRELRGRFAGCPVEFLVIDDNSKDATAANAAAEGARVIVRTQGRGLATAVVRGIREAKGTLVAVMDADFQHPTATVRELYDRAVATDADLVVGSRYAGGGSEGGFSTVRKTISRGARLMANVALPPVRHHHLTDPMSGLFLVRKSQVPLDALAPQGYKILLEVVAKADLRRVEEVGYTFADRRGGESKLGSKVIVQYVKHLAALAWRHPDNQRILRFGAVGLSGFLVNLAMVALMLLLGVEDHLALLAGIEVSIFTNFLLNDSWTFRGMRDLPWIKRCGLFHLISALTAFANLATGSILHDVFGVHILIAATVGIIVGFVPNFLGNRKFTYGGAARPKTRNWLPIVALAAVAGGAFFTGLDAWQGLYFDEEYYVWVAHEFDAGIFEDPAWANDGDLNQRPMNFEHPPLGKLILWASVHGYDSSHAYITTPRDPNNTNILGEPCRIYDGEAAIAAHSSNKDCWDGYKTILKDQGNPFAWRGPSAIMGIAAVVGIALGARRLFGNPLAGELAGLFVVADTLVLASSRIGTLDMMATGFAALAFWAATFPSRRGVLASALLLGAGFATKFYVLFLGVPILLVSMWMHHRSGRLTNQRFLLQLFGYPVAGIGVLVASYTPWWLLWIPRHGLAWSLDHFVELQGHSLKWLGFGSQGEQPYISTPAEWIQFKIPTLWLASSDCPPGAGTTCHIFAVGNPALWWTACLVAVAALGWFAFHWARSIANGFPSPRAAFQSMPRSDQALAVAALLPLMAYGCFFLLQRDQYNFYMVVVAPFFALVSGGWAAHWIRMGRVRMVVALVAAVAIGFAFFWYLPVSVGLPVSEDRYQTIMDALCWMDEDGKGALDTGC